MLILLLKVHFTLKMFRETVFRFKGQINWIWSFLSIYTYGNYIINDSRQRHTPEYLEKTTNLPQVTDEICQCLWQVGGCLRVLRFPQLIKWPTRYNWNIVALSNITLTPKHHTKKVPEFYIWANRHIIWTKSKRRLGQQKVSVLVKTILDLSQNFINKCYTHVIFETKNIF
jgi:hypothetical protein